MIRESGIFTPQPLVQKGFLQMLEHFDAYATKELWVEISGVEMRELQLYQKELKALVLGRLDEKYLKFRKEIEEA